MGFIDRYFFAPNLALKALAIVLLPLSFIYTIIAILNTKFKKKLRFNIPIISVGNLSLAGNGKTPVCKAIAREFVNYNLKPKSDFSLKNDLQNDLSSQNDLNLDNEPSSRRKIFVILRGYKRKTRGLLVVKNAYQIYADVRQCGDEAMEYAYDENIYGVIVSEVRENGISKAIELGADLVLLDDAFSKFHIVKFDILLESKIRPFFNFTLPSGAYRLPKFYAKRADFIALEGRDFHRFSSVGENVKAILISAIAKPFRLHEHFIKARACYFFADHHFFEKSELEALLKKHNCDTLMLTFKDFVKVKDMGFKCQIIELRVELESEFKQKLSDYIRSFDVFS